MAKFPEDCYRVNNLTWYDIDLVYIDQATMLDEFKANILAHRDNLRLNPKMICLLASTGFMEIVSHSRGSFTIETEDEILHFSGPIP